MSDKVDPHEEHERTSYTAAHGRVIPARKITIVIEEGVYQLLRRCVNEINADVGKAILDVETQIDMLLHDWASEVRTEMTDADRQMRRDGGRGPTPSA